MSSKLIIILAATMLFLQSCAIGKGVSHFPNRESEKCNDVTWYNPFSTAVSGWSIPYYIIPLWYVQWDHSEEDLRIEIYFKVEKKNRDLLSANDVFLRAAENKKTISPNSVKISSDDSHEDSRFLVYELKFPIASGSVEEFELVFTRPIFGCSISPINYKKSEYDFNNQIL